MQTPTPARKFKQPSTEIARRPSLYPGKRWTGAPGTLKIAPVRNGQHPTVSLDTQARKMPEPKIQGHEWWLSQAVLLDMKPKRCPKCSTQTRVSYSPPRDTLGECGIIRSCLICGWEQVHLAGRHGRPYNG